MIKHLISAQDLSKDDAVLVLDTAKELSQISDRPVKKLDRKSTRLNSSHT